MLLSLILADQEKQLQQQQQKRPQDEDGNTDDAPVVPEAIEADDEALSDDNPQTPTTTPEEMELLDGDDEAKGRMDPEEVFAAPSATDHSKGKGPSAAGRERVRKRQSPITRASISSDYEAPASAKRRRTRNDRHASRIATTDVCSHAEGTADPVANGVNEGRGDRGAEGREGEETASVGDNDRSSDSSGRYYTPDTAGGSEVCCYSIRMLLSQTKMMFLLTYFLSRARPHASVGSVGWFDNRLVSLGFEMGKERA